MPGAQAFYEGASISCMLLRASQVMNTRLPDPPAVLGQRGRSPAHAKTHIGSWKVCQAVPTLWLLAPLLAAERVSLFRSGVTASWILGLP